MPTPFVKSIKLFSESSEGFTDSDNFGVSYINIISDSNVVIYHIVNSLADNIIDESVKRGRLNYSLGSEEIVKEYDVTIEILVPE